MDGVSKVERCCPFGEFDDFSFRCEEIDHVVEEVEFEFLDEFFVIRVFKFEQLFEPLEFFVKAFAVGDTFVAVVDGNAFFCGLVHEFCSDLEFNRFVFDAFHDRMDGLVPVGFWVGNIVFERSWYWCPEAMQDA